MSDPPVSIPQTPRMVAPFATTSRPYAVTLFNKVSFYFAHLCPWPLDKAACVWLSYRGSCPAVEVSLPRKLWWGLLQTYWSWGRNKNPVRITGTLQWILALCTGAYRVSRRGSVGSGLRSKLISHVDTTGDTAYRPYRFIYTRQLNEGKVYFGLQFSGIQDTVHPYPFPSDPFPTVKLYLLKAPQPSKIVSPAREPLIQIQEPIGDILQSQYDVHKDHLPL